MSTNDATAEAPAVPTAETAETSKAGIRAVERAAEAAAPKAPRKPAARKAVRKSAAARVAARRTAANASPRPAATPPPVRKEITVSTNDFAQQAETVVEQGLEQAQKAGAVGAELGRQLTELTLDVSEKAVRQSTELYLKALEQVPVPFVKDVAQAQVDAALRVTDIVVRQGRELVQR